MIFLLIRVCFDRPNPFFLLNAQETETIYVKLKAIVNNNWNVLFIIYYNTNKWMIFNRNKQNYWIQTWYSKLWRKSFTLGYWNILRKTVKSHTENIKRNPKSSWQYAQTKCCKRSLWQKLFSLSLKPKEPTSGNRFGVTPPVMRIV